MNRHCCRRHRLGNLNVQASLHRVDGKAGLEALGYLD